MTWNVDVMAQSLDSEVVGLVLRACGFWVRENHEKTQQEAQDVPCCCCCCAGALLLVSVRASGLQDGF